MAKKSKGRRKRGEHGLAGPWDAATGAAGLLGLLPIIPEFRRKRRLCALACCELFRDDLSPPLRRVLDLSGAAPEVCLDQQTQTEVSELFDANRDHRLITVVS